MAAKGGDLAMLKRQIELGADLEQGDNVSEENGKRERDGDTDNGGNGGMGWYKCLGC